MLTKPEEKKTRGNERKNKSEEVDKINFWNNWKKIEWIGSAWMIPIEINKEADRSKNNKAEMKCKLWEFSLWNEITKQNVGLILKQSTN